MQKQLLYNPIGIQRCYVDVHAIKQLRWERIWIVIWASSPKKHVTINFSKLLSGGECLSRRTEKKFIYFIEFIMFFASSWWMIFRMYTIWLLQSRMEWNIMCFFNMMMIMNHKETIQKINLGHEKLWNCVVLILIQAPLGASMFEFQCTLLIYLFIFIWKPQICR